jgi:hypothetical protein
VTRRWPPTRWDDAGGADAICLLALSADLAADVRLGTKPRPRGSATLRDAGERDGNGDTVELAQGLDGFPAGQLVPTGCSTGRGRHDEMGLVHPHRHPRPGPGGQSDLSVDPGSPAPGISLHHLPQADLRVSPRPQHQRLQGSPKFC